MIDESKVDCRVARAVHGLRNAASDNEAEIALARHLAAEYTREELIEFAARFANGTGGIDVMMRRVVWRALVKRFGHGVRIEAGVGYTHPEVFEIGSGVFIGAGTYIQGWYDGRFELGDHVWIGPQSYFDARDIVIEDYVGWGPGAKILTSTHTGVPRDVPIVQTDLEIRPVKIEAWADVGTNAVVMPGVTIGRGSIVGAGAVVTKDVPPFAVVAGVPARFMRWREEKPGEGAKRTGEVSCRT